MSKPREDLDLELFLGVPSAPSASTSAPNRAILPSATTPTITPPNNNDLLDFNDSASLLEGEAVPGFWHDHRQKQPSTIPFGAMVLLVIFFFASCFIILFAALTTEEDLKKPAPKDPNKYYAFIRQSWLPTLCLLGLCRSKLPDGKFPGFVLDQFSRYNNSDPPGLCGSLNQHAFHAYSADSSIIQDLQTYWPRLLSDSQWKDAWEQSGICMPENGKLSQDRYFELAISFRKQHDVMHLLESSLGLNFTFVNLTEKPRPHPPAPSPSPHPSPRASPKPSPIPSPIPSPMPSPQPSLHPIPSPTVSPRPSPSPSVSPVQSLMPPVSATSSLPPSPATSAVPQQSAEESTPKPVESSSDTNDDAQTGLFNIFSLETIEESVKVFQYINIDDIVQITSFQQTIADPATGKKEVVSIEPLLLCSPPLESHSVLATHPILHSIFYCTNEKYQVVACEKEWETQQIAQQRKHCGSDLIALPTNIVIQETQ